ncbi:DNA cytosine methyltransferase [Undibacterium sp. Di26W]|uniref:DNA cytosine methyltransferase n=1 Tax=Undibacterium sp. Di26W TaxID=3413035 RepID=UPI003BF44188
MYATKKPTIGSLFAGIGGFDLGFENAGFETRLQIEINPVCRAVLADRFPGARQFNDVRECGKHNLEPVDVIVGGLPIICLDRWVHFTQRD